MFACFPVHKNPHEENELRREVMSQDNCLSQCRSLCKKDGWCPDEGRLAKDNVTLMVSSNNSCCSSLGRALPCHISVDFQFPNRWGSPFRNILLNWGGEWFKENNKSKEAR